jgi:tetratricopeptide (TPR) repeat protein
MLLKIYKSLAAYALIFLGSSCVSAAAPLQVEAEISQTGDASHLVFKGRSTWKYDVQKNGVEIKVLVPRLTQTSIAKLKSYSDSLIQAIRVNEQGLDEGTELVFQLKNKIIDSFDYQTDQPNNLIVDFYTPEQAKDQKAVDDTPAIEPKIKIAKHAKPKDRKPASSEFVKIEGPDPAPVAKKPIPDPDTIEKDLRHGIFDGGDPEFKRFSAEDYEINENALIASRANLYLKFPMLKLSSYHLQNLINNPPIYEIVPTDSQENKEARLLLTLFNNKRPAVFLKTAKQFVKTYPESKYDEMIRSMTADTHYSFWLKENSIPDFENALAIYRSLTEKYPDSPLNSRTMLLLGYSYLDRGDSFGALKAFQRFVRTKPQSKAADQVKISIGEAYLNLNRYDDALTIWDEVEKTAINKKDAIEAAYRKGDIFFEKKDFERADEEYKLAQQKFPEAYGDFPNASFNKAEAEFWSGHYREALKAYRLYLQRFPDHPHGGYAMDRIGETLEILGVNPKKYLGAYLESNFRYNGSPGARVARIRILSSRMPEMKDKEVKDAGQEMSELGKETQLADLEEFTTFLRTDGYYARHDYDKAAKELIAYYQLHPNVNNKQKFEIRIARNIAAEIKEKVDQGDFIQALRVESLYAKSWLKKSERIDVRYDTGRAFEQAGVFKEAESIYKETLEKLSALKGNSEREKNVFETLPSVDSVRLRLAMTSSRQKNFSAAEGFLKSIPDKAALNQKEEIERAQVSVDVAEAKGEYEKAQKYLESLVAAWKGQPAALADIYLRLAHLQKQSKDLTGAEKSLNQVLNLRSSSPLVSDDTHAKALEAKADLDLERGKREEAIATYRELLDAYESKRPLAPVRYKVGKILFDSGDLKSAAVAWAGLKDPNSMWQKLAQEQLDGAKWQGDYKKYMGRIPAMAPQ